MTDLLNDPEHTAIHEAGHAVVGRVVGMLCGPVTAVADHDSAGHSITADPYAIAYHWESYRGRFRDLHTVFRGRIITLMAGAEAEIELLGFVNSDGEGNSGDGDDRYQIDLMLEHADAPGDDIGKLEARLRRASRMLCRRHSEKIRLVAAALNERKHLDDDSVRQIANLPPPPDVDYWGERDPA